MLPILYPLLIAYYFLSCTYVQPEWIWARDTGPMPKKLLGRGLEDPQLLGPWALVLGPYPLWLKICASRAINRQSIGNI